MFPNNQRFVYRNNPLVDVICQLRFPQIMSINVELPTAFQEKLRRTHPIVEIRKNFDITMAGLGGASGDSVKSKPMYDFITADKTTVVTLADDFLAVKTSKYQRWEVFYSDVEFAMQTFSAIYGAPFFSRIGLRYVDLINRKTLGLEGVPWSELIRDSLLGVFAEGDEVTSKVAACFSGGLFEVDGGQCAINCGTPNPGILKAVDEEANASNDLFVIDADFFIEGQIDGAANASKRLKDFNRQARDSFRWSIKQRLHEALGPSSP